MKNVKDLLISFLLHSVAFGIVFWLTGEPYARLIPTVIAFMLSMFYTTAFAVIGGALTFPQTGPGVVAGLWLAYFTDIVYCFLLQFVSRAYMANFSFIQAGFAVSLVWLITIITGRLNLQTTITATHAMIAKVKAEMEKDENENQS